MKRELPARPDIEQLKHQVKDLLKSCKSGESTAIERIRKSHPRGAQIEISNVRLSDTQLVIAREYGFESWPKLKTAVDDILMGQGDPGMLLHRAFRDDNAGLVRKLLARYPEFKARINQPVAEAFDSPPITLVKSSA